MKWKTWLNIIISGIILFSPSCKKEVVTTSPLIVFLVR